LKIYKVTNNLNGKVYVGQTQGSLAKRWAKHCDKSSGCVALYRAISKYKKQSFSIEEIYETLDLEDLNNKEEHFISVFNSLVPNGYNINKKAQGKKFTEETIAKIAKSNTGKKRSLETRQKLSKRMLGTKLSSDTRLKMSLAKKGKPSKLKGRPWSAARRLAYESAIGIV